MQIKKNTNDYLIANLSFLYIAAVAVWLGYHNCITAAYRNNIGKKSQQKDRWGWGRIY